MGRMLLLVLGFLTNLLLLGILSLGNRGTVGVGDPPAGDPLAGNTPSGDPPAGDPPSGDPPTGDPPTGQFSVPDAYKEKGWAKKIKGLDDVYKLIDNLDSLAGKKTVVPDFEKGTPEEINAFLAALRGNTELKDYIFPENANKEIAGKIAKIFHDNGMPKAIANKIIAGYTEVEKAIMAQRFSKDGMDKMLKDNFGKDGGDYQKKSGEIINFTKGLLNAEDQAFIDTKLPNDALGVFYRLTHAVMEKFGVKEGDVPPGGDNQGGDIRKTADEIRKQIRELDGRPHTDEEKSRLTKQLRNLYAKKNKTK